MKEANIQTLLGKHLQEHSKGTFAYELKLCKGKALPFNAVKEHQIEGLYKVLHGGLHHKISDAPIFSGNKTRFNKPKPFDGLFIQGDAFVAICYYIPRAQKKVYFIPVQQFVRMEEDSERKSITEEMAKAAALFIIEL